MFRVKRKIYLSLFIILNLIQFTLADNIKESSSGIVRQMSLNFSNLLWQYEPKLIEQNIKSSIQNYNLLGITLYDKGLKQYYTAWKNNDTIEYHIGNEPVNVSFFNLADSIKNTLSYNNTDLGELIIYMTPLEKIKASKKELEYIKKHPIIKVSNENDYPPFDFVQNDHPSGYNIDLLNLLAKKIGIKIEYINGYTWNEMLNMFKKGELDLLHGVKMTKKREDFGIFSKPYRRFKTHYVIRNDEREIHSLAQLSGKRFAVGKGWYQENFLKKHYPKIKLVVFDNLPEMLEAVSDGKADVTASNKDVLQYMIKKYGLYDLKIAQWVKEMDDGEAYTHHFMAQKNTPELISLLNKALDSLSLEELGKLENKWLGTIVKKESSKLWLNEKEKAYIKHNPILKVSNEQKWAPFNYNEEGVAKGFSIDYFNLIAKKAGFEAEYISGPTWKEFTQMIQENKLDVLLNVAFNEERTKWLEFTNKHYFRVHYGLAVNLENKTINEFKDILDKTIAIEDGFWIQKWLKENHPNVKIKTYPNTLEALRAVSLSEVDVYIGNISVAGYLIKKNWLTNIKIKHLGKTNLKKGNNLFMGVAKGNKELKNILDKAMQRVSEEELSKLNSKWFGEIEQKNNNDMIKLSDEEYNYLEKKHLLKICSDPDWMPYEQINDKGIHEGIGADIIDIISKRINTPLALVPTKTWDEVLEKMINRECDLISLAMETKKREKYMNFTSSYINQPLVITTLNEYPFMADTTEIGDKKIAIVKGYAFIEVLKSQYPNLNIIEVQSVKDGLKKVLEKELFGYIDSPPAIAYAIQRDSILGLKISAKLDINMNLSIATRNDEPLLNNIMEKALNSIDEQTKKALLNRWFSIQIEEKIDYTFLWQVLFLATLAISAIFYWNRKLSALNQRILQVNEELAETQHIAGLGKWVYDVKTQKITLSKEIFHMAELNDSTKTLSFEKYLELIHPDDRVSLKENLKKALKGHPYEMELRYEKPNGSYNYTLTRAKPTILNEEIDTIQGTTLDLTRLRQTEQALQMSERQLQLVMDNAPASIAYVDFQSLVYLLVNQRFCDVFGLSKKDIVGKHIKEIIGEENFQYAIKYIKPVENGEIVSYINTFELINGKRWVNVTYVPDFDEKGVVRAIIVMSYDITDRMKAEEDLSKAKEIAEKANLAKSEFLANMSHEIRTPLNSVIGFTELLEQTQMNEQQKSYLKSIHTGGKSLLSIINDILDLSKIEAGKMKIETETTSINQLIWDIVQIFSLSAKEKSLYLEFNIEKNVPDLLILDETRLRQILLNLVGNAVKFTHKGGISIYISAQDSKDNFEQIELKIDIKDTGIGIPKEEHERIFSSFEQQSGQKNKQYGGTGLGLSICKKLIGMMNGTISLQSEPNKGSEFSISLFNVQKSKEKFHKKRKENSQKTIFKKATILVVDDIESNRKLVRDTLENKGLEIVEATDGIQAILLAKEFLPDLILMDIRMPNMDGIEATKKIKEDNKLKEIPIIALSASEKKEQNEEIFEMFLKKPISPNELIIQLQKFLKYENEQKIQEENEWQLPKQQLLQIIDENMSISLNKAINSGMFDDVKTFAIELKKSAQKEKFNGLVQFAYSLEQAVETYDVEKIENTLKQLDKTLR